MSGSSRFKSTASLQFRACEGKSVTPFSSYKIYHTASPTVRSFLLPFPRVYFIARNIRFHSTSCKHGRHLRPGISDDICSFFMSLWHSFREISYSLRARETPRRAVYGAVASSGLREIINIGSYERARSCGENSADTSPTCTAPLSSETAIFSSNIKENDLCIRSRERRNDDTFLQWFDRSKRPFQSSHFAQKFRKCIVSACVLFVCSKNGKFIQIFMILYDILCRERSFGWHLRISCSFKCRKYCFRNIGDENRLYRHLVFVRDLTWDYNQTSFDFNKLWIY